MGATQTNSIVLTHALVNFSPQLHGDPAVTSGQRNGIKSGHDSKLYVHGGPCTLGTL